MAKSRGSGVTGYSRDERITEQLNKNEKYTEWEDTTSDTHNFDPDLSFGDGDHADAQREFIKNTTNTLQLINQMTKKEREAFQNWGQGYFMSGAQYGKFSAMSPYLQEGTRVFDKYLDQVVNRQGFVVRRLATAELLLGKGNKFPDSIEQLQAMKGQIVTSNGSMSTCMAKQGLAIHASYARAHAAGKVIEYVIKIPGGSKGAGMYIGYKNINHWEGKQREYMTNRDSAFRIGNTKYDSKRDVLVTELTWVGHEKHSYD